MDADVAKNLTYRQLKEAFVSGTNGTSAAEVDTLLASASLLLLLHGLVVCLLAAATGRGDGGSQRVARGTAAVAVTGYLSCALEFVVLVWPLTLLFTAAADSLTAACFALVAADAMLLTWRCLSSGQSSGGSVSGSDAVERLRSSLGSPCTQELCRRYVTDYRGFMYLATAVCILAVDFPAFPRRFAKAEAYGKGLMDIGVGSFVFSGALVSKPPGNKEQSAGVGHPAESRSWLADMLRASKASLVLLALGAGRLIVTAGADYQSHVTEYGVHWNFFITLAVVRIASTALLSAGPRIKAWPCFAIVATVHQLALSCGGAAAFVMREGDRERPGIVGLLVANREGLVSCLGYLAIHLAGAAIGQTLRSRGCLWSGSSRGDGLHGGGRLSRGRLLAWLCFGCAASILACVICESTIEPVSRRTANLPYVFWTVHINLFVMSTVLFSNVLLSTFCSLPPTARKPNTSKELPADNDRILLVSINNNGLSFFLVANILTGLTNITIDTMSTGTSVALLVLTMYLLLVCLPVLVLYRKNYRLL